MVVMEKKISLSVMVILEYFEYLKFLSCDLTLSD